MQMWTYVMLRREIAVQSIAQTARLRHNKWPSQVRLTSGASSALRPQNIDVQFTGPDEILDKPVT